MSRALVFVAILTAMLARLAAAGECRPLTPRSAFGNLVVSGALGDIEYAPGLALDAYVQPDGRTRPLVIVIHGGGFTSGSRVAFVGQLLETLTHAGFNWVSVDYHLDGVDAYEEAVADVRAAIAFVRCHAAELHADPARLALLGEDAGATIAAYAAASDEVRAVALLGTLVNRPAAPALATADGPGVVPRAPVLMIHGDADEESPVMDAQRWCSGVAQAGRGCELVRVGRASHRPENWWPSQWAYKARLVRWLGDHLDGVPPPPPATPVDLATDAGYPAGLTKEIVYDQAHGLALDAWLPAQPGTRIGVVLVHGGGWEAGDKVTYITPLFAPLARAGLPWFSIDYRLTPAVTNREQMDDLRHAVAFLRANASRFRIDSQRLVLVGESASGQMVSLLASEDRALAGAVSFYGVYDFVPWMTTLDPRSVPVRLFRLTALDADALATVKAYSPLHQARRDMPPLLLVHGTAEELWPQGLAMASRLQAVGAPHELVAVPDAPHGMENWEGHSEWAWYRDSVVGWILKMAGE